jgi:hypothetical protein
MGYFECTIFNGTRHALHIGTTHKYAIKDSTINPGRKYTLEIDPNDTYQELVMCRGHDINGSVISCTLSLDDMAEWEEISIYTPLDDDNDDKWVGTKLRDPSMPEKVLSNPYVTKPTSILSALCCTHDFTTIEKYLFVMCMNYIYIAST